MVMVGFVMVMVTDGHEHWSWSKSAKKRLDFLYVFKVALSLVTKGIGIELPGQPKMT